MVGAAVVAVLPLPEAAGVVTAVDGRVPDDADGPCEASDKDPSVTAEPVVSSPVVSACVSDASVV